MFTYSITKTIMRSHQQTTYIHTATCLEYFWITMCTCSLLVCCVCFRMLLIGETAVMSRAITRIVLQAQLTHEPVVCMYWQSKWVVDRRTYWPLKWSAELVPTCVPRKNATCARTDVDSVSMRWSMELIWYVHLFLWQSLELVMCMALGIIFYVIYEEYFSWVLPFSLEWTLLIEVAI